MNYVVLCAKKAYAHVCMYILANIYAYKYIFLWEDLLHYTGVIFSVNSFISNSRTVRDIKYDIKKITNIT